MRKVGAIVAAASIAPSMTAGQFRDTLALNVSGELVWQRLREADLRHRSAAQKPLLSDIAKRKRLGFAYAHAQWTADDMQNVIFTDKCTICTEWNQKQGLPTSFDEVCSSFFT